MVFENMLVAGNISASGMGAERMRMEVIANNVANALSTRSPNGGPFRRQEILFEAIMNNQALGSNPANLGFGGVQVVNVVDDPTAFPQVHNPGHPDADERGFVTMPNVSIPIEMVNLMTASRGYEANLRVLQTLRQQLEHTLNLLRY